MSNDMKIQAAAPAGRSGGVLAQRTGWLPRRIPNTENRTPMSPIFTQAVAELESLGFRVSGRLDHGSIPYKIIGGRSNQRWWLVPLTNRRVTVSGLALFQPVIPSAKLLKGVAVVTAALGFSSLWGRDLLYISGGERLAEIFGNKSLHYAFFTGTDSPHRKVAVQIMDKAGNIKGFAKVSRNPEVQPLLKHEAAILNDLRLLELQSACIPTVLYSGESDGASLLVTDTLKTVRTRTAVTFNGAHLAFLRELSQKTVVPGTDGKDGVIVELHRRYAAVAERLPDEWRHRIAQGIERVAEHQESLGPRVLSHGDFTPWNTFFVDGRLYVFDWEYADQGYPVGYDLIHFLLSLPKVKRQPAGMITDQVLKLLGEIHGAGGDSAVITLFLVYLCGHGLHYATREFEVRGKVLPWDGAQETAALLDALLARKY